MKDTELIFGIMSSLKKSEYSYCDLSYLTKPFRVSENSLRTSLSRLTGRDYIKIRKEGRNALYSFGTRGLVVHENAGVSFNPPGWEKWDKKWWGILFSLPTQNKTERYHLKRKLEYYRFALRFPGFWIRPKNKLENIEEIFKKNLSSERIELIEFLFHNAINIKLVDELWKISEINENFKSSIKLMKEKLNMIRSYTPEKVFIEKMIIGDHVVKLMFKDPALPDQYMSKDWSGYLLRKTFRKWEHEVTRLSAPFWKKIINKNL